MIPKFHHGHQFYRDPAYGIAMATALIMAGTAARRRPAPQVTEAQLARAHEAALREDWNRTVAAKRAAKRARKEQK